MSTYEIVFYLVMGLASVAAVLWALSRDATHDPAPPRGYYALSFGLWLTCAAIFLRLVAAWGDLSEGWRLLAAIPIGLLSTTAALTLVLGRRGRERPSGLETG